MQDNKTLESPPEVQFAGVSRWLKENLFSSLSSSILTVLSIAAVVSVFRAIIGFFISPEREWTAVTYNLQLYMVQAYPESDFIRVWITVGLLIFLLGLSWGFNSLKEKVIIKEWCDGLLKGISSFLFIVLIAPTSVDVEGTTVEVFSNNTRYICLAVGVGLILTVYLLRKTYPKNEIVRDRISFFILIFACWFDLDHKSSNCNFYIIKRKSRSRPIPTVSQHNNHSLDNYFWLYDFCIPNRKLLKSKR